MRRTIHAGVVVRRPLFCLPVKVNYNVMSRVMCTDPELVQTRLTESAAGGDAPLNPHPALAVP
jgi:hypothetical protein